MLIDKALLHTTDSHVKRLAEAGIRTVEDLLGHYPRAVENRSDVLDAFSFVNLKEKNSVACVLETVTSERTRSGKTLTKAILKDRHGFLSEAVYFSRPFFLQKLRPGDDVVLFGKPKYEYGRLSFPSPEIAAATASGPSVVPVYSDANYVPGAWFREKMKYVRPYLSQVADLLPQEIRKRRGFRSKADNIAAIHFPETVADFERARSELAYEELFAIQFAGISRKMDLRKASEGKAKAIALNAERVKDILAKLPFEMTGKQKISLFQALKDMEKPHSMTRLLQGDVGTGKTAVAFVAAIHAVFEAGIQVALMAPTEILAKQHFASFERTFGSFGLRTDLLVGSMTKKQKEETKARLRTRETDIVIGTHALIEDDVRFSNLGLVVVDEQHRFGVEQRSALEKYFSVGGGIYPHSLNMTATPIPRTLALTLYGDQDLSVIDEYPAGRKPIVTAVVKEHQREQAYRAVDAELAAGRQVYWISPLVEESETLDVANAVNTAETLRAVFPDFEVGLVHGKMKAKEKEEAMRTFYDREVKVLSSTSVVEVGVDNPNATVIAIEAAERFGLSQLHQFRGRVGRGECQSYCYLFTTKDYTGERLRAMERTNDGFELSEIDLELRGPGEVYGVRQSGLPDLKIADLRDLSLVSQIREDIEATLS
ncbi:MAG: ATP-dependent helicase RecG [Patescibacteria group bacterium]|nr:ATP-dependent helicase RecG [Patescibacteria group bacterium]